jgi:replicative DNA helicase
MNETAIYSQDAEKALVGSVLIHQESFAELAVEAEDFYLTQNRLIWRAFQRLYRAKKAIDYLTVQDNLSIDGSLVQAGGPDYLIQLVNETISSLHVQDYAVIVRDRAERRRMVRIASEMATRAYDLDSDLDAAQGHWVEQIFTTRRRGQGACHI